MGLGDVWYQHLYTIKYHTYICCTLVMNTSGKRAQHIYQLRWTLGMNTVGWKIMLIMEKWKFLACFWLRFELCKPRSLRLSLNTGVWRMRTFRLRKRWRLWWVSHLPLSVYFTSLIHAHTQLHTHWHCPSPLHMLTYGCIHAHGTCMHTYSDTPTDVHTQTSTHTCTYTHTHTHTPHHTTPHHTTLTQSISTQTLMQLLPFAKTRCRCNCSLPHVIAESPQCIPSSTAGTEGAGPGGETAHHSASQWGTQHRHWGHSGEDQQMVSEGAGAVFWWLKLSIDTEDTQSNRR